MVEELRTLSVCNLMTVFQVCFDNTTSNLFGLIDYNRNQHKLRIDRSKKKRISATKLGVFAEGSSVALTRSSSFPCEAGLLQ